MLSTVGKVILIKFNFTCILHYLIIGAKLRNIFAKVSTALKEMFLEYSRDRRLVVPHTFIMLFGTRCVDLKVRKVWL